MKPEEQYLTVNKESWNKRVDTHFDSEFYNVKDFLKGKTLLNSIELDLLGNITGKNPAFTMPFWSGYHFTFTNGC